MTSLGQIQTYINRRRNRKKPVPYHVIADELRERYSDGSHTFTPGQLSLIASGKWDPSDPDIRVAYGLGPRVCPTCGQKHRKPSSRKPRQLTQSEEWWRSLKPEQRRFYIQLIYENKGVI